MTAAAAGDRDMAEALTTVANLDYLNCVLEKNIKGERLKNGIEPVADVIKHVRPRLVLPLTNAVYEILQKHLKSNWKPECKTPNNVIPQSFPDERFPLVWFRITGNNWDSVMIKAPKHPSRIPSNEALSKLTRLIKEVLPE